MEIDFDSRIYVAGHHGLVGSAIWRALQQHGFRNLIGRTRAELDLLDSRAVEKLFADEKPDYVFVAAAKVGKLLVVSVEDKGAMSVHRTVSTSEGARNAVVDSAGNAYLADGPKGRILVIARE